MLEDIFGENATWPAAILGAVIVAALALTGYTNGVKDQKNDEQDLRRDELIVRECADDERPKTCAEELKEMMDPLPTPLDHP